MSVAYRKWLVEVYRIIHDHFHEYERLDEDYAKIRTDDWFYAVRDDAKLFTRYPSDDVMEYELSCVKAHIKEQKDFDRLYRSYH